MGDADEVRGWRIERCKGHLGCANRAVADDDLATDLDALFAGADFGERLRSMVGGPLKRRHELVVAVADCPNACSRPQIADLGLIGAAEPVVTNEVCHQCLGCVHACREGAIRHPGQVPIVDPARCVCCGACCRSCLSGTLQVGRRGWRLLLGGKLGRHPRLATELLGLFTREGVVAAAACVMDHYLRHAAPGERLGTLLERCGDEALAACVAERAQQAGPEPRRRPAPILRGPV